ncbi:hypothetical protein PybrP1_001882 [[Pythium] brassicae (nom. inval.)]|nr:hypothetical protein PybrP1_001882 [[Pythium] brassicae (nom. inval.)]
MGVDPARTSASASPATVAGNNRSPPPSEETFSRLFDDAVRQGGAKQEPRMSPGEQDKFLSAMRDPEFRSLLSEYMTEISDPANRAETEQYLAQLEGEHKVPADKQLVRPTPGFVVKTQWCESGGASRKLFVNVCSSDKLQPPSSTPVADPATGKAGASWHLPYSLGPERLEKDRGGAAAVTFDVCFHPAAVGFATTQRAYRDMVVATCLDAVEGVLRDTRRTPAEAAGTVSVARDFRVLRGVAYKSGEPVTMCLRKAADTDATNDRKSSEPATPSAPAARPTDTVGSTATRSEAAKEAPVDVVPKHARPGAADEPLRLDLGSRSDDTSFDGSAPLLREVSSTKTRPGGATAQPTAAPALQKIAFKLVHRGKFELLHHMQAEHANVMPADRNRPKELVLTLELPTLASAAGVDLDVSAQTLKLSAKGFEPLSLALPFPVLEAKGSARFDKKARKLVVTLPVQPPPPPTKATMVIVEEDDDDGGDDGGDDNGGDDDNNDATAESQTPDDAVVLSKDDAPRPTVLREDDGFARLRETAVMVQHDPLYMRRADTSPAAAIETYDDLPPLESCSEDEGDADDADLVLVEAPPPLTTAVDTDAHAVAAKAPPFTTTETESCLSFLVGVAGVDPVSVQLDVPTRTSFVLRFVTGVDSAERHTTRELYELRVDALKHDVEPSLTEVDVASENLVVILTKSSAAGASARAPELETAAVAPVTRFQNHLLYELD